MVTTSCVLNAPRCVTTCVGITVELRSKQWLPASPFANACGQEVSSGGKSVTLWLKAVSAQTPWDCVT